MKVGCLVNNFTHLDKRCANDKRFAHPTLATDSLGLDGQWVNVKGAMPALIATKDILLMYQSKQSVAIVESYLKSNVYNFAPRAETSKAGGSAYIYMKKN